jgi:hypothetical protein
MNFKFGSVPVKIRYKNVISYYAEHNNLTVASIKNQGLVLINNLHEASIQAAANRQHPVFGVAFEYEGKGAVKGLFDYFENDIQNAPLLATCSYLNERMIKFLNRQGFKLFLADHELKSASFCKNIDLPFAFKADQYNQEYYFSKITSDLGSALANFDMTLAQPLASRQFTNTDNALGRGLLKETIDEIAKDPSKEKKWEGFYKKRCTKLEDKIQKDLKEQAKNFKKKNLNDTNILDYLQSK